MACQADATAFTPPGDVNNVFVGNRSFDEAWAAYVARHPTTATSLRRLPKVDLHCHLNGSISAPLLAHMRHLQQQQGDGVQSHYAAVQKRADALFGEKCENTTCVLEQFTEPSERMKYCFTIFDNIYKVMTSAAFTRLAVQDVLLHSAAENIMALEIRTSLREKLYKTPGAAACGDEAECITKKTYLETVIRTVEHLVGGGIVDLETGELLPLGAPIPERWWSLFARLYGSLVEEWACRENKNRRDSSDNEEEDPGKTKTTTTTADGAVEAAWGHIREHLMHRMHVRLLVSINRGHNADAAMEAVTLAKTIQREQVERFFRALRETTAASGCSTGQLSTSLRREMIRRTCWVSGIDFSGHCSKNSFTDYIPALMEARRGVSSAAFSSSYASLGITLHAGEKPDVDELTAMVQFGPERWGHLVYMDERNMAAIIAQHDAIELCITSNAVTGGYSGVAQHHIGDILMAQQSRKKEEGAGESGWVPDVMKPLCNEGSLSVAMRCRVQRRLSRWQQLPAVSAEWTDIPNVSFHTDDRGVFGTSVTEELELLLQHEGLAVGTCATLSPWKAMWALQRLSLPHVFEIPLEVMYSLTEPWEESCSCVDDHIAAHMTARVAALTDAARAELSRIELNWLLEDFDAF